MKGFSHRRKDEANQTWTWTLRKRTGNFELHTSIGPYMFKLLYEHSLVKNVSFHHLMLITERRSKMLVALMYTAQDSTLPCIN